MAWELGPLQSWYGIHEALRSGLTSLRKTAAAADVSDPATIQAMVDEGLFVLDVLRIHLLGEDGVVFPMMRAHGLPVPRGLRDDHHRELDDAHDIAAGLLTLQVVSGAPAKDILEQIRQRLERLDQDLNAHLDFEEQSVIPSCAGLATADQAAIIRGIGATTPAWLRPRLQPWMFQHMPLELATAILSAWHANMPTEYFVEVAGRLRNGLDERLWKALCEGVPQLPECAG